MIHNVTANPMMEHPFHQPRFETAGEHRSQNPLGFRPTVEPIYATRALKNLGKEVASVVALGGADGREIKVRG